MRKIFVITAREYAAAVKAKAFLVSLVLMPLMMFGGIFVQRLAEKIIDVKPKYIAVIDRSPGGELFNVLNRASEDRNANKIFDAETGRQNKAKILLERIDPADPSDEQALRLQRLELSDRVRSGKLFAFVEIGADVLDPKLNLSRAAQASTRISEMSMREQMEFQDEIIGENNGARYATNRPTNADVRDFLQNTLTREVYLRRMQLKNYPDAAKIMPLLTPPKLINHGLTKKDAVSGVITDSSRENEKLMIMVPLGLLMLLFVVVLVGASPMTANMVEEKQLRIAEVLLGSVRPFELMMGKLLGGCAVALTLAAIYIAGAYWLAKQAKVDDMVSPSLIVWFALFTVIATLMYGSMFVAAGAAVTNIKEAQSLITPVMLVIVLPMFVLQSLITDPSGTLAMIATFFPTSAPMVTIARLGIPPGIPAWQALLSALVSLVTTVIIIWAAGRIFRVGILMQGRGAKLTDMMKWIVSG